MGAKPVPASGATPWHKEDMKTQYHLIQHKSITKTHTIKAEDLEALRHNAIDEGLLPMYVIDTPKRRWIMISEEDWLGMWLGDRDDESTQST